MLDRYKIKKVLGKGGMGIVYLAYDTQTKRHVALKKIRNSLLDKEIIKKRFLREAKISSMLSHPSIIPVYDIHLNEPFYYTMPYVEGKTLKEVLETTKIESTHPIGSSIPTLLRFFLNICEAIAYIHSKNILHRDLKPDNIIIGRYGEVLILDWGIAKFINEKDIDINLDISKEDMTLTLPGKVSGTLAYMAPERAFGKPASEQTDIYSLGAILYKILTLVSPFKRKDIKTFRRTFHLEKLLDPIKLAPLREIPKRLSDICQKCLSKDRKKRYRQVEDLISDIKDYIEGNSSWAINSLLDFENPSNWQASEEILNKDESLNLSFSNSFNLKVSKLDISRNMQVKADIIFRKDSKGIGLLFNLNTKLNISEGYKIWINTKEKESEIYRSNVLIFKGNLNILPSKKFSILIEKINDKFIFYLNDEIIFSHINPLPLKGHFFAIAYKDLLFTLENLQVYSSSYNVNVNCLSIADAFFENENFDIAIREYQKISFSFPKRKEGFEAIFRCGISYIEKSKLNKNLEIQNQMLDLALIEFEKLHFSSYEPLEYIGKSLVYLEKKDFIEEAKCLELMIRKFTKHHLRSLIEEYIIYRLLQKKVDDKQNFLVILIAVRFLKKYLQNPFLEKYLENFNNNLDNSFFLESSNNLYHLLCIKISFKLNKASTILETLQNETLHSIDIQNAIFALINLKETEKAYLEIEKFKESFNVKDYNLIKLLLEYLLSKNTSSKDFFDNFIKKLALSDSNKIASNEFSVLFCFLESLLGKREFDLLFKIFQKLQEFSLEKFQKILIDSLVAKIYLIKNQDILLQKLFKKYSKNDLINKKFPLCFIYGLWIYKLKGNKIAKNIFFNNLNLTNIPKQILKNVSIAKENHSKIKSQVLLKNLELNF